LYLASTSPARLATLRAAGIEPILLPSFVDEDAAVEAATAAAREEGRLSADGTLPGPEMVLLLAKLKAEAVVGRLVDGMPINGLILGGDSAFELDNILYGKPHHPHVARERWYQQRGREGLLHSGHWIIDHRDGVVSGAIGDVSTTAVRFAANITDTEIEAYIATGEPLQVAGAFTIDSLGAPFISEVRGDPHAVVGLSLAQVRELLLHFDVAWPSLWNRGTDDVSHNGTGDVVDSP
jgi:septum formation protein